MKKSLVIGRKIVDVRQERDRCSADRETWNVTSLILDNGTALVFNVHETGGADHYIVEAFVVKLKKWED